LEISLAPGFSQVINVLKEIENRFNGFCLESTMITSRVLGPTLWRNQPGEVPWFANRNVRAASSPPLGV
jgi:uncharacterized protein Usg